MKKTVTINISGLVFHIDEDAYEKLRNYLSKLNTHFDRQKDGREIVSDIESRIAELFTSKLSSDRNVVDILMVEQIIGIMGVPEDFTDPDDVESNEESTEAKEQHYYYQKSKKLYRDPDSIVFGGVCGGLAHYLNMDKVLVRVLFILIFIFTSGVALPVYIILWIGVPKARTTAQLLEMRGEAINVENIGKKVKEGTTDKKDPQSQNPNDPVHQYQYEKKNNGPGIISKLIGLILIVFGFLSFLGFIAGGIVTTKLFGFIPGLLSTTDHNMLMSHFFSQSLGTTMIISLLVIIGIPLLLIIYLGTKLMFNFVSNSRSVFLSALGIWVIGIIIAISTAAGAVNVFSTSATESENNNLAMPSDTLFIKLSKGNYNETDYSIGFNNFKVVDNKLIANPRFTIEKSRGNYCELIINKSSKGNNYKSAKKSASKIDYSYSVSGDTLVLDPYFEFGKREKWRSQGIDITLNIPEGKVVYLDDNLLPVIHKIENRSDIWEGDMTGKYWEMKSEGLIHVK